MFISLKTLIYFSINEKFKEVDPTERDRKVSK
jgi:hypothetical protein